MAIQPRETTPATPRHQEDMAFLHRLDWCLRSLCHGDDKLLAAAIAKVMAKRIAREMANEPDAIRRFPILCKCVREFEPTLDEEAAAKVLFEQRRQVRDEFAARLGKLETESWDRLYERTYRRRKLPYIGSVLIEIGAMNPQR